MYVNTMMNKIINYYHSKFHLFYTSLIKIDYKRDRSMAQSVVSCPNCMKATPATSKMDNGNTVIQCTSCRKNFHAQVLRGQFTGRTS